jgi:hypothetical protein
LRVGALMAEPLGINTSISDMDMEDFWLSDKSRSRAESNLFLGCHHQCRCLGIDYKERLGVTTLFGFINRQALAVYLHPVDPDK